MASYLNPKTGATIGYPETKGTTAEPFNVPMAWQSSSLSYVTLNADVNGNLLVSGGITGTFSENLAQVGGVNYTLGQKPMASSMPVAISSDYFPLLQQDLIGNTNNYYPNRAWNFITGRVLASVQNTRVDMWEGPTPTYVFPTGPMQMRIVSTSANDTVGGTGVQQVHVHYLDNTYTYQIMTINLNGLTPVNTVPTNILRVNAMHATLVGTGGQSAGNISLTNLAGTVTYAFITAGYNTARQAIFTVPAGKTGYISQWQGSSGSSAGTHFTQIEIRGTTHLGVLYPGVFLYIDGVAGENFTQEVAYKTPIPIPATADVKMSAISDAVNANATAVGSIFGWIE